mgnify:CR=1 FL=1
MMTPVPTYGAADGTMMTPVPAYGVADGTMMTPVSVDGAGVTEVTMTLLPDGGTADMSAEDTAAGNSKNLRKADGRRLLTLRRNRT